ncbi:MAG TPA: heme exporter protein CcmD [Stellaceae bacterium]|nr:heme exporter protein CcmD [Stellaceae bacterium]
MSGVDHFLAMGGYAVFVWPAYGVALVVMAGLAIHGVAAYRRRRRELARLEREETR